MDKYLIKHTVRGQVKYEVVLADSSQQAYERLRENYDGEVYVILIAKVMTDWEPASDQQ